MIWFVRHQYFNSRPHGGRLVPHSLICAVPSFQLTPSRRATTSLCVWQAVLDFNSRPHGGRRAAASLCRTSREISTHALTEGDRKVWYARRIQAISTHALTEGDVGSPTETVDPAKFQLTPSRRATIPNDINRRVIVFQLTPSRRATSLCFCPWVPFVEFQLTPSRRATFVLFHFSQVFLISTHALTEGDCFTISRMVGMSHFNSRPHGGRQIRTLCTIPPAIISTHALTEGDIIDDIFLAFDVYFNSRPHGGRRRIM